MIKGDTPVEVKNIEITPNEAEISKTRKIFASWTNPEGAAKTYAYLEKVAEENAVCTDGKGWVFNNSAAQPMTSVDNVSRTYSDTDTITVEPGKTYKFIVESFNAFGDKIGEGSVDITIPAKTQEEIDAENAIAEIKTKLSSDSNIAKNKETFASSGVKTAKEAFDGNLGSRWIAETKNADEYVGVNLGKLYSLTSVAISWEGAYASEYEIQVSTDGEKYNTVKAVTATKADTAEFVFDEAVDAQFVKILCKKDGFGYPYSIWEVGAFGTEKGEGVTTVAPTTVAPAQDETTTPAKQDETTTSAKQNETTTPAKQDETTTPAKQNETTTVAPTTKAISTTAAPATVKKTTVKKTTVKATAKKLSSNKVKLSVKKVAGASKYAVQISTTKNFKKVVAKKTSKKAVFTVKSKKLKGKKKLYVRVKVYKKVNGKTVASQWSKATKIRLKK